MKEVNVNNMVKFHVITSLYSKPKHGYDLIMELNRSMEKRASPGQIYPFLQLLRKNNYVTFQRVGTRDKKVYSLTPSGKKFVRDMFQRFGGLIEIAIRPQLKVCAHCACEVYKGGFKKSIRGKNFMFCCGSCAKSFRR